VIGNDFSSPDAFARAVAEESAALATLGEELVGSDRPFVTVSGTPYVPGRVSTETDPLPTDGPVGGRGRAVTAVLGLASRGLRSTAVRMPRTVHNEGKGGFAGLLTNMARRTGVSGYPGDGTQRWPAVHALDAAVLFRLALELAPAGTSWHAVADEGDAVRDIAAVIGRRIGLPVEGSAAGNLRPPWPDLRNRPDLVQHPYPQGARLGADALEPSRRPREHPTLIDRPTPAQQCVQIARPLEAVVAVT
jgi:nucleoside-diphosphate-sugar epimerase